MQAADGHGLLANTLDVLKEQTFAQTSYSGPLCRQGSLQPYKTILSPHHIFEAVRTHLRYHVECTILWGNAYQSTQAHEELLQPAQALFQQMLSTGEIIFRGDIVQPLFGQGLRTLHSVLVQIGTSPSYR